MKKLAIVGASHFVNRMFEACGNYQWAREFVKNSIEAGAKKVEFGIEWQAVERHGIYRRIIADNGTGMTREELLSFFSTLGDGAKRIGGVHDNFGVGAKIASLPWNPEGVVVISYKDCRPSMIYIQLDDDGAEYELREFRSEKGLSHVINPAEVDWGDDVNWGTVSPPWARECGTTIVLLGTEQTPDTVLGNPKAGEDDIKGLSVYLNSRFWSPLPTEITVAELRSQRKNSWPTGPNDRDDARRPNNRKILGAKYYLTEVSATGGKLDASGIVLIDEGRVRAHWYLWEGERPHIHSYAKRPGYIAVKYKDELFELTTHKAHFRWFGIADAKVQQNLTIILEPDLFDPQISNWGIHPDQSRNRLIFTGNGEKGIGAPFSDWGFDFSDNMPKEISDAIIKSRGDTEGALEDEEYRKRLQDKFGSRWVTTQLVQAQEQDQPTRTATSTNETAEVIEQARQRARSVRKKRKTQRRVQIIRLRATDGGSGQAIERQVAVDVPKYRYVSKDEFDEPWHLACWVPNDPEGPTVLMNREAPLLLEAIRHHQQQYPEVFAADVEKIVKDTYGEVAVCKIAHSQKLAAYVAEDQLDLTYRNEAALTVSLMGLLAEESLIAQRLGKLGRKKSAA
jgi:Histidine kinase-, DNA gyrase B-, and HSP90-like ATPase